MIHHPSFTLQASELVESRFRKGLENGHYYLGLRPEDLVPSENGLFTVTVTAVELIGRERILHFTLGEQDIKSIVSVEHKIEEGDTLSFDLLRHKLFLFDQNGERVY